MPQQKKQLFHVSHQYLSDILDESYIFNFVKYQIK